MTTRDSLNTAATPANSPVCTSKKIMEEKPEETLTKLQRRRAREKKKNQEIKSRHIPQDLIDNILNRLPAKSLCRFRRVCKSWNSAISNLSKDKFKTEAVLSIFESKKGQFFHCITDQGAQTHKFPVPWENTGSDVFISNSCNGLLLICVDFCFYLFNPSTRYIAKVLTLKYGKNAGLKDMLIGLCYDELISDYKAIVRIHCHSTSETCTTMFVVASLKGKKWNSVNTTFRCSDSIVAGPVVNGRLHWLVNEKIVPFDPILNVFEEPNSFQPPPPDRKRYKSFDIGVLEGCICVSRFVYEERYVFHIEILTMKEYGASDSWTPMFVFPTIMSKEWVFKSYNPLLLKGGKILISAVLERGYRYKEYKELRLYNVGLRSFDRYQMPNRGELMCAVSFVHNFDMPKGYYWDDVEHEQFEKPEGF